RRFPMQRPEEIGEFLWHYSQIAVQNHEHIAFGRPESGPHVFRFANTRTRDEPDVLMWILADHPLHFSAGAIDRLVIAEKDLSVVAHLRNTPHCEFDIIPFVAAWNDHGNGYGDLALRLRFGTGHDELHEAQAPDSRHPRHHLVAKCR